MSCLQAGGEQPIAALLPVSQGSFWSFDSVSPPAPPTPAPAQRLLFLQEPVTRRPWCFHIPPASSGSCALCASGSRVGFVSPGCFPTWQHVLQGLLKAGHDVPSNLGRGWKCLRTSGVLGSIFPADSGFLSVAPWGVYAPKLFHLELATVALETRRCAAKVWGRHSLPGFQWTCHLHKWGTEWEKCPPQVGQSQTGFSLSTVRLCYVGDTPPCPLPALQGRGWWLWSPQDGSTRVPDSDSPHSSSRMGQNDLMSPSS